MQRHLADGQWCFGEADAGPDFLAGPCILATSKDEGCSKQRRTCLIGRLDAREKRSSRRITLGL